MVRCNHGLVQIGRRDFILTTAIASVAGNLPATGILAQEAAIPIRTRYKREAKEFASPERQSRGI